MKILHIIAGAEKGGAETFCLDAIKSLHAEGVSQHIICRPHKHFVETLDEKNIEYTPLSFNRFKKPIEQKIISSTIQHHKPDIVHCWMNRASSFVPANIKVPVLGWFGGYYNLKNYKNCDFYMGVTRDIVRHIIQETKKPNRSFLVHTFGTLEKDHPVKRSDFDVPEDARVVLLLSRMHWKKGVDTLLQAALKLDNVYFLLAGDGEELEKYKKLSQSLGLNDRVRFLGWRNDRAALLNIADVCVLPSRYEPFGTVIAESWHANVPLVATKADGAKQYVTNNVDGLLCEIDDSDKLADNIKSVLDDKNLRDNLIKNGQKTYNQLFSKEIVTTSLIKAYQNIFQTYSHQKHFINAGEPDLPPSIKKSLDKAIEESAIKTTDPLSIYKVASAYYTAHNDESNAIDAAYVQSQGLYNFVKRGFFKTRVEILSNAEIKTILSNRQPAQCIAK